MGEKSRSSGHSSKRDRSKSPEDRHKRRHKSSKHRDREHRKEHHRSSASRKDKHTQDEEEDDENMWVEKEPAIIMPSTQIEKSTDLGRDSVQGINAGTFTVGQMPTMRDAVGAMSSSIDLTDGYGEGDVGGSRYGGGALGASSCLVNEDMFSSLGSERKRRETKKPQEHEGKMNAKELNTSLYDKKGERNDAGIQTPIQKKSLPSHGSAGHQWRMARLRRVYETAKEENRSVEEVALERYGDLESFEHAKEERDFLDNRERSGQRGQRGRSSYVSEGPRTDEFGREIRSSSDKDEFGRDGRKPEESENTSDRRSSSNIIFNQPSSVSSSRSLSRSGSFRKPGEPEQPQTPTAEVLRAKTHSPVPNVFTPPVQRPSMLSKPPINASDNVDENDDGKAREKQPLSPSALNSLQAKALKARLMNADNAEALEREYDDELKRWEESKNASTEEKSGKNNLQVEVLPTLDGRGRLYDVGTSQTTIEGSDQTKLGPGNRRKTKEAKFDSRDSKTGEVLRYNADDDSQSLEELVRQAKFGAGASDQKDMDAVLASRIATDAGFQNDLDYMDDEADKFARRKMRSDAQKRMFAIQDYAKTQKALETCQFCFKEDNDGNSVPPQVPVVALGTRAYLSLPRYEPISMGHSHIVPLQHHLSSLEADEDTWDEIKNFMKTLMQMFSQQDKGVLFYETVLSHKGQRHTYIEAVPVPWSVYDDSPAYFKEAILTVESEWTQHKKLIDFSQRPGGFRRSMVAELPYFMVQWDYKGQKGYGHIIEGHDGVEGGEDGFDLDTGEKGGGAFPRYFAAEIIGNMLDVEPRRWRRPRRLHRGQDKERIDEFMSAYRGYDWTVNIKQ